MDRNLVAPVLAVGRAWSLSARRAWIEITLVQIIISGYARVALRKESVDRNNRPNGQKHINRGSLSARRAWIEI